MSQKYEGDFRCSAVEGDTHAGRCPNVATQVRREPYTPGRFKVFTCDEHADATYTFDAEATAELRQKILAEDTFARIERSDAAQDAFVRR